MSTKLALSTISIDPEQGVETVYARYNLDKPEDLLSVGHPCMLDREKPIMLDVETHKTSYEDIRTVQLYQEGWEKAIVFDTNQHKIEDIHNLIKDMHIVIHMATMEISCFQNDLKPADLPWKQYRPVNPFSRFSDTFLLARRELYDKIDGFSLDKVAAFIHKQDFYADYAACLGWTDPSKYKKFMQRSFLDTPKSSKREIHLRQEQIDYAALDVLVMPLIYNKLKKAEKHFVIQLDYKFIDRCTEYQFHGLPLDVERWQKHMNEQEQIMKECTDTLPKGLNMRSYRQVRALLNSVESDDTYLARVEDGSDLVVAPASLAALADASGLCLSVDVYGDDPEYSDLRKSWAKAIRAYRSAVKRVEYLSAYKAQYDRFGVVKGFISPRTISGRIASDEVNMTNIPRSLKDCFGVSSSSDWLIYADYSQLELRMLAAVLNEHVMIRKFMENDDLHVFAATNIYERMPEDITYEQRFIGKFFNFSGAYGAGVARLCTMLLKNAGIYMTEEDMRPLHRKWKQTFPAMESWHRANGRSKTNVDVTLLGRWYKAKLYTDLNAIKMQGSAAEVFKLAGIYMKMNRGDISTGVTVHDSFVHVRSGFDEAKDDAMVTVWCMLIAWFEVLQNAEYPYLKMPTQALVGTNWGDIDNKGVYAYEYSIDGNYEQYKYMRPYIVSGALLQHRDQIEIAESLTYEGWR